MDDKVEQQIDLSKEIKNQVWLYDIELFGLLIVMYYVVCWSSLGPTKCDFGYAEQVTLARGDINSLESELQSLNDLISGLVSLFKFYEQCWRSLYKNDC